MPGADDQMQRWRRELDATLAFSDEELDELEDHLRLSFEEKIRTGHAPSIAWSKSTAGLGAASALALEFAKGKLMPALGRLLISWWRPLLLLALFYGLLFFFKVRTEVTSSPNFWHSIAGFWPSLAAFVIAILLLVPGKACKNAILIGLGMTFGSIPLLHLFVYNRLSDQLVGPGWSDMVASFGWLPTLLGTASVVLLPVWWRRRHPLPLEETRNAIGITITIWFLLALAPFVSEVVGNLALRQLYILPAGPGVPITGPAAISYNNWIFIGSLIHSVYLTLGILPLVLVAFAGLLIVVHHAVTGTDSHAAFAPSGPFPALRDLPWILTMASTGIAWIYAHTIEIVFSERGRDMATSIHWPGIAYSGMESIVLASALVFLVCQFELTRRLRRASRVRVFYSCLPVVIGLFTVVLLPLSTPLFNLTALRPQPEISDEPAWFFWLLESLILFFVIRHALMLIGKWRRGAVETSLWKFNGDSLVQLGLLTGLIIAISGVALWLAVLQLAYESVVMIGALLQWGQSVRPAAHVLYDPRSFLVKEHLSYWLTAGIIYVAACLALGLVIAIAASTFEFIRFNGFRLYRVRKMRRQSTEILALND